MLSRNTTPPRRVGCSQLVFRPSRDNGEAISYHESTSMYRVYERIRLTSFEGNGSALQRSEGVEEERELELEPGRAGVA